MVVGFYGFALVHWDVALMRGYLEALGFDVYGWMYWF